MVMRELLDLDIPWALIDGQWYGVALQFLALIYSFLGLAIVCDDHMVPALDTLCERWGIPEDVAGATFMAFGSAAPEIIINVVATIQSVMSAGGAGQSGEQTNLGVSAILGSGMIAFSMIPATCAMFSSKPLLLKRRPLFRDEFFYLLALGMLIYIIYDGTVHMWEATCLVSVYVCYLLTVIFAAPVRRCYRTAVLGETLEKKKSFADKKKNPKVAIERGQDDDHLRKPLMNHYDVADDDEEDDKLGKAGAHDEESDEEEPSGCFGIFIHVISKPLHWAFFLTCPDVSEGSPLQCLYPLTFLMSFMWVSVFSFLLSSVIERWVAVSGVSMAVFGLLLVSLGAEVPDTIESVSVAKKGYGSMAVSNCQGTQVINIAIGLGLSWTIACGQSPITLSTDLLIPAFVQVGLVVCNMSLLLGYALCTGADKAVLNKTKAYMLYGIYVSAILVFIGIMASEGKLFN